MKSQKAQNLWKNIRPAIIVFVLIFVVVAAHMMVKPSKIDSIESNRYEDNISEDTIKSLKSAAHLHQVSYHHDRYTGIEHNVVSSGPYKGVVFEADYYKSRNILDLTPIGKKLNYKLCRESRTRNAQTIQNTTDIVDGVIEYDASLKKQVNDPYLGVQLTAHTPHNHIPVLFSAQNNKSRYNTLRTNKLVRPAGLL